MVGFSQSNSRSEQSAPFFSGIINITENGVDQESAAEYIHAYLKLNKTINFIPKQSFVDALGFSHIRYTIFLNNHKILGSEIIAHFKNNQLQSFNGVLFDVQASDVGINPATAVELVLSKINANLYNWELPSEEQMLKLWTGDSTASYYPKAKLVYAPKSLHFIVGNWALCYGFEINAIEPLIKTRVYVNAVTGEIWAEENLLHNGDAKGTANTKYRGTKNITTDSINASLFRLRESGRGGGIETYNMQNGTSYGASVDFTDTDNYWNNINANQDEVAGDAHYGAEVTYDYYLGKFNRNSYDDNGAKIRSYVHYGSNYSNAFWNGNVMTYGDGNGTSWNPLTSLDVCGHEITHAVTTNSAALVYAYESGALNESFSDIFGNAIEYFADSNQFSWKIGEDIVANGSGLRDMSNPNSKNDPNTYLGSYWYSGSGDNGGVHTNSGVQNYWFYLLTDGGAGTNDNGDAFNISGIGIKKAEAIAYRNLTVYLFNSAQYEDAREYSIQAAKDLYGACSNEVVQTTNAWYAVGVGDAFDSTGFVADFEGNASICDTTQLVQFINTSLNANTFTWDFGDGETSTKINPEHQYKQFGKYTVKLIAEGCFVGLKDTVTKIDYVVVDSTNDICNAIIMPVYGWDTVYACFGVIYDNGGEEDYTTQVRDTLTISSYQSDSIHLTFTEFNYESNYDYLRIYEGPDANGNLSLIAVLTGNSLPANGAPIKINSDKVTLVHFSDQLLVESGFKASYKAFRRPLRMNLMPDSTLCYNQIVNIHVNPDGGYKENYRFWWNNIPGDSFIQTQFRKDTNLYVQFTDVCTKEFLSDSVKIKVRSPLKMNSFNDTAVCYGQKLSLVAEASGGRKSTHIFQWNPGIVFNDSFDFYPTQDTIITVILSDGCSPQYVVKKINVKVSDAIISSKLNRDTTLCQGNEFRFKTRAKGGIGTLSFLHSDGTVSGPDTLDSWVIYPQQSAQFWVLAQDGCTVNIDTLRVNITVKDSLHLVLTGSDSLCFGESSFLKAIVSGGTNNAYSYKWSNALSSVASHLVTPDSNITYYVQVSDGCSAFEPKDSISIIVSDPLFATIEAPDTICFNEKIEVRARVNGGKKNEVSFTWGTSTDTLLNLQLKQDTILNLKATDGCSLPKGEDEHRIVVREEFKIALNEDTAICSGDSLLIRLNIAGGAEYGTEVLWFESSFNGNGTHFSYKPTAEKDVYVVVNNACGILRDSFNIGYKITPEADFDYQTFYCTKLPNFINNSTIASGQDLNYLWEFGDGNTSQDKDPKHEYQDTGSYQVRLYVSSDDGCSDDALSEWISLYTDPEAQFYYSPEQPDFINSEIRFFNRSEGANQFSWQFGDGGLGNDENPVYQYLDTGLYQVSLVVTGDGGCSDTATATLRIAEVYQVLIPNAFTPNNDGLNDEFTPHVRGMNTYKIVVYNRWGAILFTSEDSNETWNGKTQDGSYLEEGHYFYVVVGEDLKGNKVRIRDTVLLLR